jgi:hypothetical protein
VVVYIEYSEVLSQVGWWGNLCSPTFGLGPKYWYKYGCCPMGQSIFVDLTRRLTSVEWANAGEKVALGGAILIWHVVLTVN